MLLGMRHPLIHIVLVAVWISQRISSKRHQPISASTSERCQCCLFCFLLVGGVLLILLLFLVLVARTSQIRAGLGRVREHFGPDSSCEVSHSANHVEYGHHVL